MMEVTEHTHIDFNCIHYIVQKLNIYSFAVGLLFLVSEGVQKIFLQEFYHRSYIFLERRTLLCHSLFPSVSDPYVSVACVLSWEQQQKILLLDDLNLTNDLMSNRKVSSLL